MLTNSPPPKGSPTTSNHSSPHSNNTSPENSSRDLAGKAAVQPRTPSALFPPSPSRKKDVDIIECTRYKMHDHIRALIKRGDDVNEQNESGTYAVVLAAENNDLETLKILVNEGGARIDVKNGSGSSPLSYAAEYQNWGMHEFILQQLKQDQAFSLGNPPTCKK